MSIKDSNFNLQISMSMNKSCDNLDYFGFTDLNKKKLNEDELNLKLKQVREVTNCNEELAIINLHDCNYNVEYAINKILTHESSNEGEWKTKKAKQKKAISKEKDQDKNQDHTKEKIQNSTESVTEVTENCDKKLSLPYTKKESFCGKTFKNFNLSKRLNNNYIIPDYHRKNALKPEINFLLNGKWNEKTIIFENSKFPAMPIKDIAVMLRNDKGEKIDRSSPVQSNEKKDNIEDVSIVFKTHCTTKPPPKVLCSLVAPVQIINKTSKPHSLPKFKFGDTDFNEDIKKPDFNTDLNNKMNNSDSKFVDIEDHSIIKVGPSQKIVNNQPICNFPTDIFNANHSYFNSPNFPMKPQSNLCNNNVKSDFNMKKPIDIAEYPYMNVLHPGSTNPPNCNSNISSINAFNSSMSPKEINTNSKPHDVFLNHTSPLGYSQQANVNHVKSTIYLVPNVMVNPISGLYMSVNNPLPASALSPPMAPIASQFNMAQQQPPPMFYDDSLQSDDIANKNHMVLRQQYNQNRHFQRFKKNGPDVPDELSMKTDNFTKSNLKNMPSIPLNQNSITKQIPFNFPLFISSASVASHNQSQMFMNNPINSNSFSSFPNGYQPHQESNNNEHARKRNVQVQNGNFHGKAWS